MSINYDVLPRHMRAGARTYIEHHVSPGSFLKAVIQNDLSQAYACADEINREAMHDIVQFFRCEAPPNCSGSPKAMVEWLNQE